MSRRIFFLGLFWWTMALGGAAQKYVAEKSVITFFSEAPLEDITASNTKTASLLYLPGGEVAFSVPIREFQFEKKLMQEHFNEKYMESHKYPRATFSGQLQNLDVGKTGEQKVKAKGRLTVHGVAREVEIEGTAQVDERVVLQAKFVIKLADFNIKIPQLLFQNIAEEIEVSVYIQYKSP